MSVNILTQSKRASSSLLFCLLSSSLLSSSLLSSSLFFSSSLFWTDDGGMTDRIQQRSGGNQVVLPQHVTHILTFFQSDAVEELSGSVFSPNGL